MAAMIQFPVPAPSLRRVEPNWTAAPQALPAIAGPGFPAVIKAVVIPRLMLHWSHPSTLPAPQPVIAPAPGARDVETLAQLMLGADELAGMELIEALRTRGVRVDSLYLDLLAPAARRLGEMWGEDHCDFASVTLGLLSLQRLRQRLVPRFGISSRTDQPLRRILLTTLPGEQHVFGQAMLADFFRHARWDVCAPAAVTQRGTVAAVRQEWFDVVGFSVSDAGRLDVLANAIRAVRRASCNAALGILVGGPVFLANPEYATQVGADATAADARQATLQAERLRTLLAQQR